MSRNRTTTKSKPQTKSARPTTAELEERVRSAEVRAEAARVAATAAHWVGPFSASETKKARYRVEVKLHERNAVVAETDLEQARRRLSARRAIDAEKRKAKQAGAAVPVAAESQVGQLRGAMVDEFEASVRRDRAEYQARLRERRSQPW